ncbi:MAG TPA: hypothetical protein PK020_04705 [Ilumatobacteraceae bacterium]|nr:hypothetical protein [Ilumatobacteraceae bacterium]HRB03612.1 hypothetical protein [Ilumatobacteraceae bacterium]
MTIETEQTIDAGGIGRRGLFRIGGLSAAALAIAACADNTVAGTVGRVGEGGTTPVLEDPIVNDGVFLRTMAGISTSIANAYGRILKGGSLTKASPTLPDLGDQTDLVKLLQSHHTSAAKTFNKLAREAGADEWTCGNTRLDSASIDPIFDRVENGAPATDSSKAIGPSDDATRDYINLVFCLESLSASSCQAMVPALSQAAMRFTTMQVGIRSARQAALIALRIFPGGYVAGFGESATPAATTTTTAAPVGAPPAPTAIPLPVAVPSRFGLLSPTVFIGGAGDENGVRLKISFETPSLNTFAYPFSTCP